MRGKQPAPAWAAGGEVVGVVGAEAAAEAAAALAPEARIAKTMEEQKEVVEAEMIIGVVATDLSRAPNAGVRWLTPLSRER